MDERTKKFTAVILCLAVLITVCGCSFKESSIEDLMQPPQLTASRKQIRDALTSLVGSAYQLVSPQSGSGFSGINLTDLDGDGENEAVCLYTAGSPALVNVAVLKNEGSGWVKIGHFASDATAVDRLEFCDLDGSGVDDIVIGFGYLTGSDHVLQILKLDNGSLVSLHQAMYNRFVTVGEETKRLVVLNTAGASATLLGMKEGAIRSLSSVPMDSRAQSILSLQTAKTSGGLAAVYVDSQLDNQMYTTEVLVISADDFLENRLFTAEHMLGDRPNAVKCTDINGDGVPEVPQAVAMTDTENTAYFTYWYSFDGSGLSEPTVTFTSASEQFYFLYPEKWKKTVIVSRDEKSERTIRFVKRRTGEALYSLRAFTPAEYAALTENGWQTIIRSTDRVIAVRTEQAAPDSALTADEWKAALHTYGENGGKV